MKEIVEIAVMCIGGVCLLVGAVTLSYVLFQIVKEDKKK